MKIKFLNILVSFAIVFALLPFVSFTEQEKEASAEAVYPYTKTFTITAYYSPLPCQKKYATGSYERDIRLNGSGIRSADGTPVYPGMIAAPRSYAFGTKMKIPGVGTVSVHDRGGAIVQGDGENTFDRLDIWMGYGDKGLTRALNWGKRTLDVTVYGVDPSITENIYLSDYSPDEAIPNQCEVVEDKDVPPPSGPGDTASSPAPPKTVDDRGRLVADLKFGDRGDHVSALQRELSNLNYFRTSVTGYYGEVTRHAVFKFQQAQGLVGDIDSPGAGVFGPKTRDAMNRIIIARDYNNRMIAEATESQGQNLVASNDIDSSVSSFGGDETAFSGHKLSKELDFGLSDPEVAALQRLLKDKGFFDGLLITNYFGPVTRDAVLRFQLANGIISSESDTGAGRVGPSTLSVLNG